jgi:hypothetical protein
MENNLKVSIIEFQVDWLGIKNLCRSTISMKDSTKEPLREWKRKLLLAEHSPLRHSLITVQIDNIPYCNAMHFVRHHEGVTPYVTTSRDDRTGVDRSTRKQTDPVSMRMDMNIQALINISRKRLCNQADRTTQIIWLEVIKAVAAYDEDIAWACVPEGIRTCGCPEKFGTCHACENIISVMNFDDRMDLEKRYDHYNNHRNKVLKKELVKCRDI